MAKEKKAKELKEKREQQTKELKEKREAEKQSIQVRQRQRQRQWPRGQIRAPMAPYLCGAAQAGT